MTRTILSSSPAAIAALCLALTGCPSPTPPTDAGRDTPIGSDGGVDAPTTLDAGTDAPSEMVDTGTETDVPPGTDTGTEPDAPVIGMDSGVVATWNDCREAVVFGSDGEPCSFTGSCVECSLVASPRQVLCMAGRLRVAAAGPGACMGGTDAGVFTFPDAPVDGGGVDGGGMCPPLVVPAPTEAACSDATVTCLRDGGDPTMCITADAPCLACVQSDLAACATTAGGCDDEAGAAQCCFNENCPDGSCSATTCMAEWDAYVTCFRAAPCSIGDVCFPSAPACPPAAWPAPEAPGCTSATLDCILAATTGAELQACIDADTASTPAGESCDTCINNDLISCGTSNGCDDELGFVECCLNVECPAGDATCVNAALATGGACEPDWSTFFDCVNPLITDGTCGITPVCFP